MDEGEISRVVRENLAIGGGTWGSDYLSTRMEIFTCLNDLCAYI